MKATIAKADSRTFLVERKKYIIPKAKIAGLSTIARGKEARSPSPQFPPAPPPWQNIIGLKAINATTAAVPTMTSKTFASNLSNLIVLLRADHITAHE